MKLSLAHRKQQCVVLAIGLSSLMISFVYLYDNSDWLQFLSPAEAAEPIQTENDAAVSMSELDNVSIPEVDANDKDIDISTPGVNETPVLADDKEENNVVGTPLQTTNSTGIEVSVVDVDGETVDSAVGQQPALDPPQTSIQKALNQIFRYNWPPLPDQCKELCKCRLVVDNTGIKCDSNTSPHPGSIHYAHRVCPQNFRNLADVVFTWNAEHHGEHHFVSPRFEDLIPCIRPGAIIYVVGWSIDAFFNDIYPLIQHPFVLITGESDLSVPWGQNLHFVQDGDSKVMHWFGQNGEIFTDSNTRFTQIPIGLNCYEQYMYIDEAVMDLNSLDNSNSSIVTVPGVDTLGYDVHKTLVLNFDQSTNSAGERVRAWSHFCDMPPTITPAQQMLRNHTVCFPKDRGVQQYFNVMKNMYKRNIQYRFWLSPRGNGVDCHRTWEALYFGRIPVMLHTTVDTLLQGLPALIVDQWEDVTFKLLEDFWKQYVKKRRAGIYDMSKLGMEYWRSLILNISRHKSVAQMADIFRETRCWSI